jgi:hypothetical protein
MIDVLSLLWVAIAPQNPDSVHFTQALKAVDDSLTGVRRAAAELRADLASASPALVLSRAGRQRAQCTGSRAAVTELQRVLGSRVYTPRAAAAQQALRAEAAAMRQALERCERDWAPGVGPEPARADSLRVWAPHRLAQLQRAIRRYQLKAASFRGRAALK